MLISINEQDVQPLYLQITSQVKEQVRKGTLKPGNELPSVRELADSLGINMHTVRSAYLRLREQGIINLRLGRRAVIARVHKPAHTIEMETEIQARLKELITDALLMGFSSDDFRDLVDRQLNLMKEGE
jgi:GntR family transcriptional regulator